MADRIQTPRPSKGNRPQYFDDPNMDQMHAMIVALATEVSVLTDRFDTIERVLEEKGQRAVSPGPTSRLGNRMKPHGKSGASNGNN